MANKNNAFKEDVLAITGGSGFLGSAFLDILDNSMFKDVKLIRSKDYDLRDLHEADKALKGATMVVHIAGITGGIGWINDNPGSTFYDNIMMNTNVLHSCMTHGVKKAVCIGTVCSYPKFAKAPFKEDEIWDGYPDEVNAPYGLAKKMLIVQSDAYARQYKLNSQVLLMTNLYGPRDTFESGKSHVVPALIVRFTEAIKKKMPVVTLWGDGSPTRDLLYVEDAAQAILRSLLLESTAIPLNIGSGKEVSIKDLAEMLKNILGGRFRVEWDTSRPNGQPHRILDISKAKKELGFEPAFSLEEGLKRTIAWYEKQHQ